MFLTTCVLFFVGHYYHNRERGGKNLTMLLSLILWMLFIPGNEMTNHSHGDTDPVDRTCALIKNYNPDYFLPDPQCGSDGITYQNMCAFSQAHCEVRNLHIAHTGRCVTSVGSTTQKPGGDAVFQFFCHNLSHQQCGSEEKILCGSDGVTYTNLCMFEKARCQDQTLSVVGYLACP